jgi:hypothetical protein
LDSLIVNRYRHHTLEMSAVYTYIHTYVYSIICPRKTGTFAVGRTASAAGTSSLRADEQEIAAVAAPEVLALIVPTSYQDCMSDLTANLHIIRGAVPLIPRTYLIPSQ